ncbi:hypothetical protein [Chryseobacterium lineare]
MKKNNNKKANIIIPDLRRMNRQEVLVTLEPYRLLMDKEEALVFLLYKTWYGENTLLLVFFNEEKVEWYTQRIRYWFEKISIHQL